MKEKIKNILSKLKAKAKDAFTTIKRTKDKIALRVGTAMISAFALAAPAFATSGGSGSSGGAGAGDAQFQTVINFFATWIGRIGLIVGFVGAVMFGLAIKNDDADAKTRGLMTLAAGFVVFGVTQALDMFLV